MEAITLIDQLSQESVHGDITERRLEVEEREGKKRMVTLLQLSSWSPGELPHPTSILSLVELLSKTQRNSPSRHTTIICRSAASLSLVSLYLIQRIYRDKVSYYSIEMVVLHSYTMSYKVNTFVCR